VLKDDAYLPPTFTEDAIVNAAVELEKLDRPLGQLGIQFLQVGNDADAAAWLQHLDNNLKDKRHSDDEARVRVSQSFLRIFILEFLSPINSFVLHRIWSTLCLMFGERNWTLFRYCWEGLTDW
jgi:hypothetical protein